MQDDNFIGPPKPEWKLSDKLSDHFTLDELTRSQTAVRKNIDNTPQDIDIERLQALCENVLEPIRIHFDNPITISSGFRAPELNTAIGGSTTSQHCIGEATDFIVHNTQLRTVWEWIILESGIDFDQVIYEFGRWIHISHKKWGTNRNQIMIASKVNSATKYATFTKKQVKAGEHNIVLKTILDD